jgi:hypothetical protein
MPTLSPPLTLILIIRFARTTFATKVNVDDYGSQRGLRAMQPDRGDPRGSVHLINTTEIDEVAERVAAWVRGEQPPAREEPGGG